MNSVSYAVNCLKFCPQIPSNEGLDLTQLLKPTETNSQSVFCKYLTDIHIIQPHSCFGCFDFLSSCSYVTTYPSNFSLIRILIGNLNGEIYKQI